MLDSKYFRQDIEEAAARLKKRGFELDVAKITELEEKRKALQTKTQELQSERNSSSKAIGQAKAKGEDVQPLLDAVANLGDQLSAAKEEQDKILAELNDYAMSLPNLPAEEVPAGADESENVEISTWVSQSNLTLKLKIMLTLVKRLIRVSISRLVLS